MTSASTRLLCAVLTLLAGTLLLAPPARADTIVAWDEQVDGSLSSDPAAPTWIGALTEGDNVVRGKVVGWSDRFLFDVDLGLEILAARVEITTLNGAGVVEMSLSALDLEQTLAATQVGTLAFDAFDHAGAGTYLAEVYGLAGQDPRFRYEWHLEIAPAQASYTANPEPGTLALMGVGALGLALHRRRRARRGA